MENLGVAEDPRGQEERDRDYLHLASASPVAWIEKPQSEWKSYTERDQDGSLSCVGQSAAKAIEVLSKGTVTSAHPIYRSRFNYPSGGMWLQNCGDIAKHIGTTTEALDVSQKIGEIEMNRDITVQTPQKVAGYVMVNPKDIDAIAEAIRTYGNCLMTFGGNRKEWKDVPVYNPALAEDIRHCVCGVDFFLYNGKKAILIEDSWGNATTLGNGGQRIITEDYLKARFFDAMYLIPKTFSFTRTMRYGSVGEDVRQMQKILKITPDGIFGRATLSALKNFQYHNGLTVDGIAGPKTRAVLSTFL